MKTAIPWTAFLIQTESLVKAIPLDIARIPSRLLIDPVPCLTGGIDWRPEQPRHQHMTMNTCSYYVPVYYDACVCLLSSVGTSHEWRRKNSERRLIVCGHGRAMRLLESQALWTVHFFVPKKVRCSLKIPEIRKTNHFIKAKQHSFSLFERPKNRQGSYLYFFLFRGEIGDRTFSHRRPSHRTLSHRHLHIRTVSHKDIFTHRQFHTRTVSHRDSFTQATFTWAFSRK